MTAVRGKPVENLWLQTTPLIRELDSKKSFVFTSGQGPLTINFNSIMFVFAGIVLLIDGIEAVVLKLWLVELKFERTSKPLRVEVLERKVSSDSLNLNQKSSALIAV